MKKNRKSKQPTRRFSDCKTGLDIQNRIIYLAALEIKDASDALERYDKWKRTAHPSLLPSPMV